MPYRQRNTPVRASDYTVAEFAEKFNLAESTVRYKISAKTIPSYLVGGARRIPADYVEQVSTADPLDLEIQRIVDRAPKLTASQRDKLATLLAVEPVAEAAS
jgi:excisionase family DNA binding protein